MNDLKIFENKEFGEIRTVVKMVSLGLSARM